MPNNVYIGSRYVPVFDGAWDNTKSYEPLTIVEYGNNTYTSKRPVPVGTLPTDTSYWALTGNYNGQIAHLQDQIDDNTSDIQALTNKTSKIITFEEYGAVGDGVANDTSAISNAITYASTHDVILTSLGGTYLINADITIPSNVIMCSFGIIKSTNLSKITINMGSSVTYGIFEGVKVETQSYFVELAHIKIQNVSSGYCLRLLPASGISVNAMATSKISTNYSNICILNEIDSTAIGVYSECVDMSFSDVEIINCLIGFRLIANDRLVNCNVWINNIITDYDSSIGYKIDGQNVRLTNCTADTLKLAISLNTTYLTITLEGFTILFNSVIKQNKDFTFIDRYGNLLGDITVVLTGASANNNIFYLGYQSRLDVSFINGSAADYAIVIYNLTADHNGVISQVNCKREKGICKFKFYADFGATDFPIGDNCDITIDKPFADLSGLMGASIRNYYIPCIYHNSSGDMVGFALAQIIASNKLRITSTYPPSGATHIVKAVFDIAVPVPLDVI